MKEERAARDLSRQTREAEAGIDRSERALRDMEDNVRSVLDKLESEYGQVVNHLRDVDNMINNNFDK